MSRKTENQLSDYAKWYYYHSKTITDPDKRHQFLEDAFSSMILLITYLVEDIQRLEDRHKTNILLPKGVKFTEDARP